MFQKWSDFVREVDPDVITGYNICNFDLPYLLNRAKHLKLDFFKYLGRMKDIKSDINYIPKNRWLSWWPKFLGKEGWKSIKMEGRVQYDMHPVSEHHLIKKNV